MSDITLLIYEEDAGLMSKWALNYPNIETGGDLFGLWQSESEVVVQLAIGPGGNCQRTPTSFHQDRRYLGNVGNHLTTREGLCNVGEWHSHHCLNLPKPSGGDKETVWRHMPSYGLKRFLLVIATINDLGGVDLHSFMFTAPESGQNHGGMFPTRYKILPGPNPFRAQDRVIEILYDGAENVKTTSSENGLSYREKKERKKQKNQKKKERKKEKKEQKKQKAHEKKERKRREKEEREEKRQRDRKEKDERKQEKNQAKENKKKKVEIFENNGSNYGCDGGNSKQGNFLQPNRLRNRKEPTASPPYEILHNSELKKGMLERGDGETYTDDQSWPSQESSRVNHCGSATTEARKSYV